MQFLHWLSRATNEKAIDHQDSTKSTTSTTNQKEKKLISGTNNNKGVDNQAKRQLIVLKRDNAEPNKKGGSKEGIKVSFKKYLKLFLFCRNKDIATACFYTTINLKSPIDEKLRKDWIFDYSMRTKKEEVMAKALIIANKANDPSGSNKVLPITEMTTTNDENCSVGCALEKKEKAKTISRMKELLRWAAAAKTSEKGGKFIGRKVQQFRNRRNSKSTSDDLDQFSIESPKISFRWDVESCSTTSSRFSTISVTSMKNNNPNLNMISLISASNNDKNYKDIMDHQSPTTKGNWITTDSDFVVLEL